MIEAIHAAHSRKVARPLAPNLGEQSRMYCKLIQLHNWL